MHAWSSRPGRGNLDCCNRGGGGAVNASPMEAGRTLRKGGIDLVDGFSARQASIVLQALCMYLHIPHSVQVEELQQGPCSHAPYVMACRMAPVHSKTLLAKVPGGIPVFQASFQYNSHCIAGCPGRCACMESPGAQHASVSAALFPCPSEMLSRGRLGRIGLEAQRMPVGCKNGTAADSRPAEACKPIKRRHTHTSAHTHSSKRHQPCGQPAL